MAIATIPLKVRGRLICNYLTRVSFTKKKRRHSGWTQSRPTIKATRKYIIDNCLEPHNYWDDWVDHRDGYRNGIMDQSKFRRPYCGWNCDICDNIPKRNKKLKKLTKRREAKKLGRAAVVLRL